MLVRNAVPCTDAGLQQAERGEEAGHAGADDDRVRRFRGVDGGRAAAVHAIQHQFFLQERQVVPRHFTACDPVDHAADAVV